MSGLGVPIRPNHRLHENHAFLSHWCRWTERYCSDLFSENIWQHSNQQFVVATALLPNPIKSNILRFLILEILIASNEISFTTHAIPVNISTLFQYCTSKCSQNAVRFHSDHNAYITREDTVYEWWLIEIVNKFHSVIQKPSKFDPTFLLLEQLILISRNSQYLHLHAQTTEVG